MNNHIGKLFVHIDLIVCLTSFLGINPWLRNLSCDCYIGEDGEVLANIFGDKNPGKARDWVMWAGKVKPDKEGIVGRRGCGGGEVVVAAFDGMGLTMGDANGLRSWLVGVGEDGCWGRLVSAEATFAVSDEGSAGFACWRKGEVMKSAPIIFGLGEVGLTTAVLAAGVEVDRGGLGDDKPRIFLPIPASLIVRVSLRGCCWILSSSSESSTSSSLKSSLRWCLKKWELVEDNKLSMLKAVIFFRLASAELVTF